MSFTIETNRALQTDIAADLRIRIVQLQRDNRLTDELKMYFLGEMSGLATALFISAEDELELRELLGHDFVFSKSQLFELAENGQLESEFKYD